MPESNGKLPPDPDLWLARIDLVAQATLPEGFGYFVILTSMTEEPGKRHAEIRTNLEEDELVSCCTGLLSKMGHEDVYSAADEEPEG